MVALQSIARKRAAKMLPAARLSQARLHNATVPINRLPPEICMEIMLLLRSDFGLQPAFSRVVNDSDPPFLASPVPQISWLSVAQACTRWWDLACGTTQLWRVVIVRENLNWLHLCLSRSGEALLELCLCCYNVRRVIPIITPVKDRITRLFIPDMPRKHIPALTAFFDQGLPNLGEAILSGDLCGAEVAVPVPGFLDPSKVPQLRHLAVREFPILWIPEVTPQLVSLDIQWIIWSDSCLDLGLFLSLLQAAKSLQYLRLHEVLWQGVSWTSKPSASDRTLISLPSLRTLDLYDYPSCVAGFLEFFNLPVTVALGVHGLDWEPRDDYFPDSVPSFLHLLPQDFRNIEVLSSATYARMEDDPRGIVELTAKVEPYTQDYLAVSFGVQRDSNASTFVPLFDHFLQVFRYAPLDTIKLYGNIAQVPTEKWTSLFVQFPNLLTLKIGCGSSLASVFCRKELGGAATNPTASALTAETPGENGARKAATSSRH